MSTASPELLDRIEALTGHRFTDGALLLRALTHPSWAHEHGGPDYQRLEFLGDAVVGLCVTRRLVELYPDVPEGDLTDLRQRVVATKALGRVGRAMGLGPLLRLGGSEAAKATVEARILGDVVEALLGALLTEAGYTTCQAVVDRWLVPHVEGLRTEHAADAVKNAVNRLQELTQGRWGITPDYAFDAVGPAHALTFTATVSLAEEALATGEGRTKKAAMKEAASLALAILDRRGRRAEAP
ncbi:MAG: ribonuclease III [Alphaproteobacteria bacterium]|nr:ribonuclease III [Alphaproteobacteria bacterium]